MIERELSFWSVDVERARARLRNLAKLEYSCIIENLYFTFPLADEDTLFRIRTTSGESVICAKGPRFSSDAKCRDEFETCISSREIGIELFKFAGALCYDNPEERWREEWSLPEGASVCIDTFADLRVPSYIEIEARSKQEIFSIAEEIGLLEKPDVQYGTSTFVEFLAFYGASFDDILRPLPIEVINANNIVNRESKSLIISEEKCISKVFKIGNREIVVENRSIGGYVFFGEQSLGLENPESITELLKLAGATEVLRSQ